MAREYKTAKFGILNSRGVHCACGRFTGVAAAAVAFRAVVSGLPALSAGGSAIL
ncbi:MAG: hypothetical protein WB660_30310 [Candidatus Sulfotelmatobacter sp.]